MASLGSVVSTALTGGDAPVFESAAKEVKALAKDTKKTNDDVQTLRDEVRELKELLVAQAKANTAEEATPTKARTATKAKTEDK